VGAVHTYRYPPRADTRRPTNLNRIVVNRGSVRKRSERSNVTQLIRSLATTINALAGAHFCAPRRRARLRLRLVLVDPKRQNSEPRVVTFDGYTSDISATGLAILLPVACFSEQLLNQGHRTFRIVLELAAGAIEADAAFVRYERVRQNEGVVELGCLIGAQIINMRANDRERFIQHLHSIN